MTPPHIERLEREDLAMFINACFACTGQAEFYGDSKGQAVSIEFLHEYILGNYRRLYARTLAAGINHFNQSLIVLNLLATGAQTPRAPTARHEEGALIATALRKLPPPRAWRVLEQLRTRKINNRRARAVAREYLNARPDSALDAVKYRPRLLAAVTHAHCPLPGELPEFLFGEPRRRAEPFVTPLFDAWRRASKEPEAIYELPYSVAEGFAAKHRIPRDEFLQRIEENLTPNERLRLQRTARAEGVSVPNDLRRVDLTRLCLYALSFDENQRGARRDQLDRALTLAADRALRRAPMRLGRVAAVLDRSYSAGGSSQKLRRPLAVALGASYLLRLAAREYKAFWTGSFGSERSELMVEAGEQSDLATPLVEALAWGAELVVIVSDGYENDPPGGVAEVARVWRTYQDRERKVSIVHVNPVFDPGSFAPKALGGGVPTVGLHDAEDLLTMLGFARFAEGTGSLAELEDYLAARARRFLGEHAPVEDDPGDAFEERDPA